jgi:predicted branched-subunit amino acid permease
MLASFNASLYPWLRHLPPIKRYSILLVISDANWALSLQAFNRRIRDGLIVWRGLALWLAWVLGTGLGFYFGNIIHHPALLGLDMVMACFLMAMVVGGQKNLRILII